MSELSEEQRAIVRRQFADFHERLRALEALHRLSVQPALRAIPKLTPLDVSVFGLHLRALAWGFSLSRLNDVFDFQAHAAGCRSLSEVVVDIVLLTRGVEPVDKMLEWEQLAKFRAARKALAGPAGFPGARRAAAQFAADKQASVAAAKEKHWPGNPNPLRWTGQSLVNDLGRADGIDPRLKLGEFAREHLDRLNWATHGSTLLLVRDISEGLFPGLSTLAVHECTKLLASTIRLALEHFKAFDDEWERRIRATYVTSVRLESMGKALDEAIDAAEHRKPGQ